MHKKRLNAFSIYLIMVAAEWLIFSLFDTVVYIYLAEQVTGDPFQLVFIYTVFTLTSILFEIPTGLVADVYSRRLSVIIGYVLIGIGALIEGGFPIYVVVLFAQVLWGIGHTFISGAQDAWIADEVGEEKVSQAYMQSSQVGQVAFLIGIPISTALATISLQLPILVAGLLFIALAAFLILFMPEEGFQRIPGEHRDSWGKVWITFKESIQLVRGKAVLVAILVISAVYGLSAAGFDNLWTVFMLETQTFPRWGNFQPVVWFGFFNTVVTVLGLLGTELVRRRAELTRQSVVVKTLMVLTGLTAICMIVFGLARNFWLAGVVFSLSLTFRTICGPLFRIWINQNVESNVRATVMSMESQTFSLGQAVGGPIIGAIGSAVSLPAALVTTGFARLPIAILYQRLILRKGKGSGEEG
jgi:DHA3 family tetracycline resistance protein-like MFS transporter